MTDAPMTADEKLPLAPWAIWLLCFLFPVIAGAAFYYAWKGTNPKAANYANRASWISAGVWVAVALVRHLVL